MWVRGFFWALDGLLPFGIAPHVSEGVVTSFMQVVSRAIDTALVGGGCGPFELLVEPFQVTCYDHQDSSPDLLTVRQPAFSQVLEAVFQHVPPWLSGLCHLATLGHTAQQKLASLD